MRKLLVSTLFFLCMASAVMAQDPVQVDSKHYKVEFENDEVRVLRVKIGPKEKSVMHQHPNAVAIFLTDATGRFTFPKDPAQDITRKAGDVLWTPGTVHLPENVSDKPFEVIVVELKSKSAARNVDKRAATRATSTNGN